LGVTLAAARIDAKDVEEVIVGFAEAPAGNSIEMIQQKPD